MAGWGIRRELMDDVLQHIALRPEGEKAGQTLGYATSLYGLSTDTVRTYILELEAAGHITITGSGRLFKERVVKVTKKGMAYLTGLDPTQAEIDAMGKKGRKKE